MTSIFDSRPRIFATTFYGSLVPGIDDEGRGIARLQALLERVAAAGKHEILRKSVQESIDSAVRVVKCRQRVLAWSG